MARRKKNNGGGISGVVATLCLFCVLGYLIPIVLPYIVGAVIVFGLILIISKVRENANAKTASNSTTLSHSSTVSNANNQPSGTQTPRTISTLSPATKALANTETMKRHAQILKDCEELVNESDNLATVAHRYGLLIETLEYFASIPDYMLQAGGIHFGKPVNEYLLEVQSKETAIFCQTIERAGEKCRKRIQVLKTHAGKENALQRFYDDVSMIVAKYNLPSTECLGQLNKVYQEIKDEISPKGDDTEFPYVSISTSGDERVCRMCKQFEGKLFRVSEAPQLPLHPLCGCAYEFHENPGRRKIRNPADFVMPASCAPVFSVNANKIMQEKDIFQRIRLCEEGLAMLEDFLAPYRSARWNPPEILPCVEWSIHDYMALGEWEKALQATRTCVEAGALKPEAGKSQELFIQKVSDASSLTLEYLSQNPGTLQRNMYKKLCPPCDREALKWFLANSMQIQKQKVDKTNKLYVATNGVQVDTI